MKRWLGTPMASAVTTVASAANSMFALFNSDLLQPTQKKIKGAIREEKKEDAAIQTTADTAAEKTANASELNRTLTNVLNDSRNSIPNESTETPVAAPVVSPAAVAAATTAVANATIGEINANLALDNELSKEKPSDNLNEKILQEENSLIIDEIKESMQAFIESQKDITTFRQECINKAVKQFQEALRTYNIPVADETSGAIMGKIAGSWSEFIISSTTDDSSIYLSVKTFFFRVNQAIDALLTQCIFLSNSWKALQIAQPPRPVFPFHLMSTSNYQISYPKVNVGPCWYTIGPILDFQNIEGRIFIYVKCCLTEQSTDGIYCWVYRSQSEGLYRVFFKLDPFGAIEKGFDYTQGTFDDCRLQMALCNYYDIHYRQGMKNPIKVDTLTRLNYFMSQMPYLQATNFLDNFPGKTIKPSFYSRIWKKLYEGLSDEQTIDLNARIVTAKCAQHGDKDEDNCCYVCLTQLYEAPTPPLTQRPGMIGHYYIIDDSFASIIKRGFPLHPPSLTNSDWLHVVNMICKKKRPDVNLENQLAIANELQPEWETQCALYFPENEGTPGTPVNPNYRLNYDFSRRRMKYGTTCPYIFCFTTCGLVQSCPMFKLFLSANSYKTTFWCQGFQNYTAMLLNAGVPSGVLEGGAPPNRKILSPVLHIVIGALLRNADMALSTLRNIILNIGIMSDARMISQQHNEATKAIMTLGTRRKYGDPGTSVRMPGVPPARSAPFPGLKSIQTNLRSNGDESLGLQFTPGRHRMIKNDQALDAIVEKNVNMKINMIKCLEKYYNEKKDIEGFPFVDEVIRLLKYPHPSKPHHDTTLNFADTGAVTSAIADAKNNTAETVATNFITASPEAAAAALFGYISNPTDFVQDLTDFAHLCLKKEWIRGIMGDAYHALEGVFNPVNAIHNYLGEDGEFHQFVPAPPPPPVPAPPPPVPTPPPPVPTPLPYVLISSFDEVRKEDTSPTNPDPTELNVTVVTFAHIYRVDCRYNVVDSSADELKSMSIIYQISTTIVYTREVNPRILYAMNHRTPLVCLPDVFKNFGTATTMDGGMPQKTSTTIPKNPKKGKGKGSIRATSAAAAATAATAATAAAEAAKQLRQQQEAAAEQLRQQQAEQLLNSAHTLFATYQRVTSYGALFAGKMMEYFFGGDNGYYQLPYFFKNFDKFLKVCHQYDSTVLMYLPDVSPYDLLVPHPSAPPLLSQISTYFTGLGITLDKDSIDIQTKLKKNTKDIQAISDYLTKDFMVDTSILDVPITESQLSQQSHTGSTSSTSSRSSMSSKSLNAIEFIFFKDFSDRASDSTFTPSSQDSQSLLGFSLEGGTLPIKYHIKKSVTTRKNKNKNKPRTKSRTPVRRITIRIKRLMKSKVTKPKTYKRRATGGKRKTKPNKTMRRYRRVRK